MGILTATGISKTYAVGDRRIPVLEDVSLSISDGTFVVVKGPSGSGKSTLLAILSGIDRPDEGSVTICGREITRMTEDQLAPLRNGEVGFVFQSFHLVPSLTALENITFPAEIAQERKSYDAIVQRGEALLDQVGLFERRDSFPHQLSGGEKQRVAICRAVINGPKIVFADEPTGNLDTKSGQKVLSLLAAMVRSVDTTLVVATHSDEIVRRADRVISLLDGRIRE